MNKTSEISLSKFATELASALGGVAKCRPDNNHFAAITGTEVPISLYKRGYGSDINRVAVRVTPPSNARGMSFTARDCYPTPESADVTVDGTRPPCNVAADLRRRFFPKALAEYRALVNCARKSDEYFDGMLLAAASLAEFIPGAEVNPGSGGNAASVTVPYGGLVCKVDVRTEGSRITLDASNDELREVLALLKAKGFLG